MEHLQLGRTAKSAGPTDDDMLAIRHPFGREVQTAVATRDLRGVREIQPKRPDILATASIGHEHDRLPIGAEAGLHVEGHSLRDAGRAPALDGHRVQITQQVEDDGLAVRTHVQRNPGALRGREAGLA